MIFKEMGSENSGNFHAMACNVSTVSIQQCWGARVARGVRCCSKKGVKKEKETMQKETIK